QFISNDVRNELIERIRSNVIHLQIDHKYSTNIDSFLSKQNFSQEKGIYRLDIKAEPVARLHLRMIEENDINNLSMYEYMGADADSRFSRILTTISVIEMLYRGNKRVYVYDIKIDEAKAKQMLHKCHMVGVKAGKDELLDDYQFILKHYVKDIVPNTITAPGASYGFTPRFNFPKKVVDTYFAYLLWINQPKIGDTTIESVAKDNGLEYVEELKILLESF
ncbi:MAG: hypothetical protein IJY96_02125, partial [Oscillospiraceae bacterium]|nr:hypothetical protein [Oscillospiraceae bacterium]